MYLLICTLEKGISKEKVIDAVGDESTIKVLTWLNGESGQSKEPSLFPIIVGSLSSFTRNKEQDVLLAKISGKENVQPIIQKIKSCKAIDSSIEYFVVPLVA